MPLFLTLRGATNALPITSAWVGLKPATTNPTWTTANHSQIVSRLHRVAYPGGSILTSRGGLILDSAEAETTPSGLKTRRFERILSELESCLDLHQRMGTRLGGVHLELTGEGVTECVGGSGGLAENDLSRDYRTAVDPRLNREQALEMAMRLAEHIARRRIPTKISSLPSLL
jgi:hypothetical protein